MCLYTKSLEAKVAKKNIVCYKLLRENIVYPSKKRYYYTPFREVGITLGQEANAFGDVETGHRHLFPESVFPEYDNTIHSGVIHTFKTFKDMEDFMLKFENAYTIRDAVVVRCVIPKGTEYYEGIFEKTGINSYASKKIIYGGRVLKRYYNLKEEERWYKVTSNR